MATNASNAILPTARGNLGLGAANDVIFNSLGIGGASSITLPLQDGDAWDSTGPSQDARIALFTPFVGSGNAHGFRAYRNYTGSGSASSFNDYDAFSTITQAGTDVTTHYAGYQARPNINTGTTGVSGANLPRFIGFQAIPLLATGTTVDNYWGFYNAPNNTQGTVTDAKAFYARSMNTVAHPTWAATAWSFYADSDPAFFGGAVDIGTASYASGLHNFSVMNTGRQRLVSVGTSVGGGGVYVAGLGSTGAASGRPTNDTSQILLDRETTAQNGGIEFVVSGATNGYGFKWAAPNAASGVATRSTDLLLFARNNSATWSEVMRVSPGSTAVVGIGNSLMDANLSVGSTVGTFRVYNAVTNATDTEYGEASWSSGVLNVGTVKTGAGTARPMALRTDGTSAVTISTAQAVTFAGAMLAPNLATSSAATTGTMCWTTGTGNINVDTTTTCLASSMRFKHDWNPIIPADALTEVMRYKPGTFIYNDDLKIPGVQSGFTAEDMAEVNPDLVTYDEGGKPLKIKTLGIIAKLTAAVQEQQSEIAALKARVH